MFVQDFAKEFFDEREHWWIVPNEHCIMVASLNIGPFAVRNVPHDIRSFSISVNVTRRTEKTLLRSKEQNWTLQIWEVKTH